MISIVIATYNRRDFLPRSIKSILDQTYKDFEIIVIDDGSTDDTESLFKDQFSDAKIRYIKLPENKGATFARNAGLAEVRGEYFLVWDSDDMLYPHALETVIDIYKKNEKLAIVSAPARSLLNGNEIVFPKLPEGIVPHDTIACRSMPSNHKVRIAKTSLCGDIRYKARNIDFLVNVEMGERGEWYCYPEYLADVILESDSNSLTIQRKKTNLGMAILRSPYLSQYVIKYKDILNKKCPERYAGFSYGAAIGFFASGNKIESKRLLREAWKAQKSFKYLFLYILTVIPFGLFLFKMAVQVKNKIV